MDGHIFREVSPLAHDSLQFFRGDIVGAHQRSQFFWYAQCDEIGRKQSLGYDFRGLWSRDGQDIILGF